MGVISDVYPAGSAATLENAATTTETVLRIAAAEPDRVFTTYVTVDSEFRLTYGDLVSHARRAASVIDAHCEGEGNVVIIMLAHGPDMAAAFLGAIFAGQLPSLFPTNASKVSLAALNAALKDAVVHTCAKLLVTDEETKERFALESSVPLSTPQEWRTASPLKPRIPRADDIAFVQHSSGTTGHKKGVAISHRALLTQVSHYAQSIALAPTDVIASWLPLYHDMGLITCFLLPLLRKIPVVSMSPFDWIASPARWLKAISKERATVCWMPNFAFQFMAQRASEQDLHGVRLDSLRAVINCAEPITCAAQEAFFDRFHRHGLQPSAQSTCYAMAENTFAITQSRPGYPPSRIRADLNALQTDGHIVPAEEGTPGRTLVSSGRPLEGVGIRILGSLGEDLSESRIGEIAIRTDCMLTEYHGRPDLTQQAIQNGWYRTGDLGFLADGSLFVTGRKKDLIIVAGKNLYPEDIEAVVSNVPGTKAGRAAAFGVFEEKKGTETLVVLAELDPESNLEVGTIRKELLSSVASELECTIDVLRLLEPGTLVKSTSGKISRSGCKTLYLEGAVEELAPNVETGAEIGDANIALKATYILAGIVETLVHAASLIVPSVILVHAPSNPLLLALALLGAFYAYVVGIMLLVATLMRLLPKPRTGLVRHPQDWRRWSLLMSLAVFARRTPARWYAWVFPPGQLYFRLCGGGIHPSVLLTGMDQIAEPYLVEVGEGTILGRESTLTAHFVPRIGSMILGRIRIGKKVLVGRGAQIWPNVIIGDNAVIQERSSVMPGTIVPSGEVWGGVPARPITRTRTPSRQESRSPAHASSSPAEIRGYLLSMLRERAGAEEMAIDATTPVAETGVLDSMSFLTLLGEVESHFAIRIEADVLDYRTVTIDDLVRRSVAA